jgi:hypothetical protein
VVGSHHFFEADPAMKRCVLLEAWSGGITFKKTTHLPLRQQGETAKSAVSKMYDCIQKCPRNSGIGLSFSIESWPTGGENLSLSCELLASQKFFEKVAPGGLKGTGKVV